MDTVKERLPKEYLSRMKLQLGDDFDSFVKCMEEPCYKALRLNRCKISPVEYASMCRLVAGLKCEEVSWWPGAFYYDDAEPGKHPLHAAGSYYIQEPSAMIPVTMLDINDSGLKVLDLCAAPGGKSSQIADLMQGCGLLVSNEIIPSRASILSENTERMGVVNALVLNEEPAVLAGRFPAFFDRILVDAPCSGEGMFRKNPEAASEWSPENVNMCAQRQNMLLDVAASMLAPGGKIVYSTCTFSPEEDEGAADRFLAAHPEFEIAGGPEHIYPHTHKGEGHFAVSFIRSAERDLFASSGPSKVDKHGVSKNKGKALDRIENALLCDFFDESLC
nr:RsmB/NOP family class I SAM-dependent RNA methyltransferase [Lachnospiraceae bacterium]